MISTKTGFGSDTNMTLQKQDRIVKNNIRSSLQDINDIYLIWLVVLKRPFSITKIWYA